MTMKQPRECYACPWAAAPGAIPLPVSGEEASKLSFVASAALSLFASDKPGAASNGRMFAVVLLFSLSCPLLSVLLV